MAQAARDPKNRPNRMQLRQALGFGSNDEFVDDAEPVDESRPEDRFESQALMALLEAMTDLRTRLDRLEAAQTQTADTIATIGEWLQRSRTGDAGAAPEWRDAIRALDERIDALGATTLAALQRPVAPSSHPLATYPEVDDAAVDTSSVLPTLRRVLAVALELRARPDLGPEMHRVLDALEARSHSA
jgi:hypothetical protein